MLRKIQALLPALMILSLVMFSGCADKETTDEASQVPLKIKLLPEPRLQLLMLFIIISL